MEDRAARRSPDATWDMSLDWGRAVIEHESRTLAELAGRLDHRFQQAAESVLRCSGCVIVSGMGKAGLVGRKIAATLASTGSRAHFLHPAEAIHGDLGRIHADDLVLMLSQSGETEEVVRLLPSIRALGAPILAITASAKSTLGRAAEINLELGRLQESGDLGLAPSASTTAMLALGDALALVVSRMRGFQAEDFARFHPGGSLGRKLSRVEEHMRPLERCRVARDDETLRSVYVEHGQPDRRTGAIMLLDSDGRLTGVFTDSDLARLFERRKDQAFDGPIRDVMTALPTTVEIGARMLEAVHVMAERKISELPVLDTDGRPVGLIDITDVVGAFPECEGAMGDGPELKVFPTNAPRSA